jgi:hypothetical protein
MTCATYIAALQVEATAYLHLGYLLLVIALVAGAVAVFVRLDEVRAVAAIVAGVAAFLGGMAVSFNLGTSVAPESDREAVGLCRPERGAP